jgi:glucose/arabinose dehydrogenase
VIIIAVVVATKFYWQNLRGAYEAIKEPTPDDVAEYVREEKGAFVIPKGYTMEVFAKNLGAPRDLVYDPRGVVVASIPARGQIVALPDSEKNGAADQTIILASNLNKPHGVVLRVTR